MRTGKSNCEPTEMAKGIIPERLCVRLSALADVVKHHKLNQSSEVVIWMIIIGLAESIIYRLN